MAVFWKCINRGMKGTHRGLGTGLSLLANAVAFLKSFTDCKIGDNGDLFISMNGR